MTSTGSFEILLRVIRHPWITSKCRFNSFIDNNVLFRHWSHSSQFGFVTDLRTLLEFKIELFSSELFLSEFFLSRLFLTHFKTWMRFRLFSLTARMNETCKLKMDKICSRFSIRSCIRLSLFSQSKTVETSHVASDVYVDFTLGKIHVVFEPCNLHLCWQPSAMSNASFLYLREL